MAGYKHDEGKASNIVLREFEAVTVVANSAGGGSCSCSGGGVRTLRGLSGGVHTRRGCSPARAWPALRCGIRPTVMCNFICSGRGEGAEKMRTAKVRDGSVIFYRVGDPNRVVLDGPDRMSARSNG